jgi:hypothetical protein
VDGIINSKSKIQIYLEIISAKGWYSGNTKDFSLPNFSTLD